MNKPTAICPRCGSTNTRVTAPASLGGRFPGDIPTGDIWRCDNCHHNWLAKVGSTEPVLPGGGDDHVD